ncbi:MAG: hypothetical protein V4580_02135 [Bacteroidota bacterium]
MKFFLIAVFFLVQTLMTAQDTIYKRTGAVIPAKIFEVNIKDVSYKRSDLPDGPLFIITKNEIKKIKYFTGAVDSFTVSKVESARQVVIRNPVYTTAVGPNPNEINTTFRRGTYLFQGHHISDRHVMMMAVEKNMSWKNADIQSNISEYKRHKTLQYVIGFAGAFVGATGLYISAIGGSSGSANDLAIGGVAAILSAGVLVSSQIVSFQYKLKRVTNSNKVAKLYNDLSKN